MTQQVEYQITNQNLSINVAFAIKQFNISNTSQYPIYVKIGSSVPTSKDFDFFVQASSDFTSPEINANSINIYTTASDFLNTAKITIYDYKRSDASNNSYQNTQSYISNVFGYPSNGISQVNYYSSIRYFLPDIRMDKFSYLYLVPRGNSIPLMLRSGNNGNIIDVLLARKGRSFARYVPNDILSVNNQSFEFISPVLGNVTFDAYLSDNLIIRHNKSMSEQMQFNGGIATLQAWFCVAPPAFYIEFYGVSSGSINHSISILIELLDITSKNVLVIYSNTFNVTNVELLANRLINPKLFLTSDFRFMRITVTNLLFSVFDVRFSVMNYDDN